MGTISPPVAARPDPGADDAGTLFEDSGLDRDLPQLPEPTDDSALAGHVREVNELVRHLWNALHGLSDIGGSEDGSHITAARTVVRDLRRMVQDGVEALPNEYARTECNAVIAVYSLLR
jgi:hypothetical protein